MPSEAEVWILVDPVQDHEETLEILGVYPSLDDAKTGSTQMGAKTRYSYPGKELVQIPRDREVQHWRGRTLIGYWTFDYEQNEWHTRDGYGGSTYPA